jgi:hypothetical protein
VVTFTINYTVRPGALGMHQYAYQPKVVDFHRLVRMIAILALVTGGHHRC